MKSWIQNQFLKLENYFSVSKGVKRKIDIWIIGYIIFISLYIIFWIEYSNLNQFITITLLIFIGIVTPFKGTIFQRVALTILFVLINPLLKSMLFFWDDRILKLLVMILIVSISLLIKPRELFAITKIIIVINVIFCLITIFNFYNSKFEFHQNNNPQMSQLITQNDADKDIYIIMLDGFPDQEVLSKYCNYQSNFLKYLKQNGFKEEKSLSKFGSTFQSVTNIFSGVIFDRNSSFSTKNIEKMKKLLPGNFLNNFSSKYQYQLHFSSLLIDPSNPSTKYLYGRGVDFSIYNYSLIDRLLKLIPHYQDSYDLEFEEINQNNQKLLHQALTNSKKQLNFYHFLTFHTPYFFMNNKDKIIKEAEDAGNIGLKAVEMIHQQKKSAKIIIFSDHGERSPLIERKDILKGILYIKN